MMGLYEYQNIGAIVKFIEWYKLAYYKKNI